MRLPRARPRRPADADADAAADAAPAVPLLRGRLHQACAVAAVPAAVTVVRAASTPAARRAATGYGAALVGVFSVSAAYHRGRWTPSQRRALKRLDHTAIFAFAASSYLPLSLVLPEPQRGLLRAVSVSGALVGSAWKAVRLDGPGGVADGLYLLTGWAGLLVLPALREVLPDAELALLLVGGVVYTLGAGVLVVRRPDPAPAVLGYHEVGHLVMLGGTVLHYALHRRLVGRR